LNRYCKRLYGGGGCWASRTGFAGFTDQKVKELFNRKERKETQREEEEKKKKRKKKIPEISQVV
jgi:hypothetical protein